MCVHMKKGSEDTWEMCLPPNVWGFYWNSNFNLCVFTAMLLRLACWVCLWGWLLEGEEYACCCVFSRNGARAGQGRAEWLEGHRPSSGLCSSASSVLLLFSSSSPGMLPEYIAFLLLQQQESLLPSVRNTPDFSWLVVNYYVSLGLEYNNRIM